MTNLREAAKMALEALQESKPIDINDPTAFYRSAHAIEALRALLAQPEPEPVAWMYNGNLHEFDPSDWAVNKVTPLYTAPPQREWQGLTDDELHALHYELKCAAMGATSTLGMYRILEKALKEKNNG